MTESNGTRAGRILRAGGGIGCGFICLWGIYAAIWPNRPLDISAAIYSVATVAMACFIFWNLAAMAHHMVDGLFTPDLRLQPAPAKKIVKPDA